MSKSKKVITKIDQTESVTTITITTPNGTRIIKTDSTAWTGLKRIVKIAIRELEQGANNANA